MHKMIMYQWGGLPKEEMTVQIWPGPYDSGPRSPLILNYSQLSKSEQLLVDEWLEKRREIRELREKENHERVS